MYRTSPARADCTPGQREALGFSAFPSGILGPFARTIRPQMEVRVRMIATREMAVLSSLACCRQRPFRRQPLVRLGPCVVDSGGP